MRSWTRATIFACFFATLVVGAVACSLNPQPLPPQDGVTSDAGYTADAGADVSLPFGDASLNQDGGGSSDATAEAAPPTQDAGSDGGDASTDGGDAGDASTDAVSE